MRILSANDVRRALPMERGINAMREAFAAHARRHVHVPLRTHLELNDLTSLTMPATMRGPDRVGAKLLTIVPGNSKRGLPAIQGIVILFDPESGSTLGLLDGTALTAIRTGAASGLATDLMARKDANVLAMIGAGPQAETQVEAICVVRDVEEIRVYSRTPDRVRRFVSALRDRVAPRRVTAAESVASAVAKADIICTATRSTQPLITAAMVAPGTHVNAIGSYTPHMHELDESLLRAARVAVDDRDAATSESGELIKAIEIGNILDTSLIELGEIVEGSVPGRSNDDEITVFKSVGLAIQDLAAGAMALEYASHEGLGIVVDL